MEYFVAGTQKAHEAECDMRIPSSGMEDEVQLGSSGGPGQPLHLQQVVFSDGDPGREHQRGIAPKVRPFLKSLGIGHSSFTCRAVGVGDSTGCCVGGQPAEFTSRRGFLASSGRFKQLLHTEPYNAQWQLEISAGFLVEVAVAYPPGQAANGRGQPEREGNFWSLREQIAVITVRPPYGNEELHATSRLVSKISDGRDSRANLSL